LSGELQTGSEEFGWHSQAGLCAENNIEEKAVPVSIWTWTISIAMSTRKVYGSWISYL